MGAAAGRGRHPKQVTIADVARAAGVSVGTVSHVLNNKPVVAPPTRQRVLAVARGLGYSPDAVGRALSLGRMRTIALCGPIATNLSISGNIHAASQCADRAGYGLVCCSTDNDPDRELAILEMLLAQRVAAIVTHGAIPSPAPYQRLLDAGIPVVFTRHRPPGLAADLVVSDYYDGTLRAIRHLLEGGRRRIALLVGAIREEPARARVAAYRRAYAEAALAVDEGLIRFDLNNHTAGEAAADDLLDLPCPPDAIVAGVGDLTLGALSCLRRRHTAIPEQVAFVGTGDLPWAKLLNPSLTMIEVDAQEIGRRSVELALARLSPERRDLPPQDVYLPINFAVRESTAPRLSQPTLPATADAL